MIDDKRKGDGAKVRRARVRPHPRLLACNTCRALGQLRLACAACHGRGFEFVDVSDIDGTTSTVRLKSIESVQTNAVHSSAINGHMSWVVTMRLAAGGAPHRVLFSTAASATAFHNALIGVDTMVPDADATTSADDKPV